MSETPKPLRVWLEPNTKGGIDAPKREGDSGYDLRSAEGTVLYPGESATLNTGVHVELPDGTCGLIIGRSGNNIGGALGVVGLIDSGFRGQIRVVLNYTSADGEAPYFVVRLGDRIAQLLVLPYLAPALEFVPQLEFLAPSERGSAGFGSTGKA